MKLPPFFYGLISGIIIGFILFYKGCGPDCPEGVVSVKTDTIPQKPIVKHTEDITPKRIPPPEAIKVYPKIDTTKQNLYTKTITDTTYRLTIKAITNGTLEALITDFKITPPPQVTKTVTIYEPCPTKLSLYAGLTVNSTEQVYVSALLRNKSGSKIYTLGYDPLNKNVELGAYFNLFK
jgi:hypothetical protein